MYFQVPCFCGLLRFIVLLKQSDWLVILKKLIHKFITYFVLDISHVLLHTYVITYYEDAKPLKFACIEAKLRAL